MQIDDNDGIEIDNNNVNRNSTDIASPVMIVDVANNEMTVVDDVDNTMEESDAIEPNVTMPSTKARDEKIFHVSRDIPSKVDVEFETKESKTDVGFAENPKMKRKDADRQRCFRHDVDEKIVARVNMLDMHEKVPKISLAIEDVVTKSGHSFVLTQNPHRCIDESNENGACGLTMRLPNTLAQRFCTSYSGGITTSLK